MAVSENIVNRRDYLQQWLKPEFKNIPVSFGVEDEKILIKFQEMLICGVQVGEEYYRIFNASEEWKEQTTYHCDKEDDGSWFYYVESAEECIAECKRLVMFEAKKNGRKKDDLGYSSAPIESEFWQNRFRSILGSKLKESASGRKVESGKSVLRFECYGSGSAKRLRVYLHNEGDEHDDDPEIISIRIGHEVLSEEIVQSIKPAGVYFKHFKDECKVRFDIQSGNRKEDIEKAFAFIEDVMSRSKM